MVRQPRFFLFLVSHYELFLNVQPDLTRFFLAHHSVYVEGTLSGLPREGRRGRHNGDAERTNRLKISGADYFRGPNGVAYGNVVEDGVAGGEFFLRDDHAWRTATHMPSAPPGVVTIRNSRVANGTMSGNAYHNTVFNGSTSMLDFADGDVVRFRTNWREAPVEIGAHLGGHLVHSAPPHSRTYYVEREFVLWPPYIDPGQWLEMRRRLPPPGSGRTTLDVLNAELARLGDFGRETLGPCLSMPRLLFGSKDSLPGDGSGYVPLAPPGFRDGDYVTLRYRHHALKEGHVNKYQKAIVDVSRLPADYFDGEAESIHIPIKYHCRRDPPRWSASLLRVHHYLDSWEAYSYRNDARAAKRNCREVRFVFCCSLTPLRQKLERTVCARLLRVDVQKYCSLTDSIEKCYDEKGKEAAEGSSDVVRHWLGGFVAAVGEAKAKELLAGAGSFVRLE